MSVTPTLQAYSRHTNTSLHDLLVVYVDLFPPTNAVACSITMLELNEIMISHNISQISFMFPSSVSDCPVNILQYFRS
jgi:hypothetical protein